MAIERVSKVVIAVHREKRDEFLTNLQRLGIFHITQTGWQPSDSAQRVPSGEEEMVQQLIKTIELLSKTEDASKKPRGRKQKVKDKVYLNRDEYEEIALTYEPIQQLNQIENLNKRREELQNRLRVIADETGQLTPWKKLPYSPRELTAFSKVKVLLGRFPSRTDFIKAQEMLLEREAALQMVEEEGGIVFAIVAVAMEMLPEVVAILQVCRWEEVDLPKKEKKPADALVELEEEKKGIIQEVKRIEEELLRLSDELPKLKVKADALLNGQKRKEVSAILPHTDSVFLIYGWIKDRDMPKLASLVQKTDFVTFARIKPEENENPPVALVNRRLWRPFELVLELYQLPLPNELDPTWLIAPFFGMFFALCLTDAGYGIVLAIITYFLMRRMGVDNKLLGIILIGAILTIPAGALVGGWFGDIPDRLGIGWLAAFKNRVMWFDPMKEPLKFFILSIALGYIQLITGIVFEIADCLRTKNYGEGLLGQLPWFLFLNSLTLRLAFGKSLPLWANSLLLILLLFAIAAIVVFTRRERATIFSQWLWFGLLGLFFIYISARMGWLPTLFLKIKWLILALFLGMIGYAGVTLIQNPKSKISKMVSIGLGVAVLIGVVLYLLHILPAVVPGILGIVFYFLSPAGQRLVKKFMWGGYALYGATSYLGVLLSYIRLMALGMCTGGVAVAINVIAWMILPVPVLGPLLALIVLVIGHSYNIAVNVLGAFVHSLRLQYVEFFPRFYTGGGEPFVPFREERRFVVTYETGK